ncbi:MAG: glycosyltransferase family 2 protein [Proteobacteria bacterium]|nr:glycosyltransferase family 2 protein [Pseudomonadota bacterium]
MSRDVALTRYLERHIEAGLPRAPMGSQHWQHVIVIPAYNERPELLSAFSQLSTSGKVLIILVINRPDSDLNTQSNSALRNALDNIGSTRNTSSQHPIYHLNSAVDLFCYDLERISGPIPAAQGVGLARKIGCDIAFLWQSQGAISTQWICCTDADAILPSDYFSRLEQFDDSVAAVYPFAHAPGISEDINRATILYEIRLHQYVLGLIYAKSPYAYHTLGSCIAVKCQHYAEVRGYPKRSGGEDFYLLNKLAKLGPVTSLTGECIQLQSRMSHRVPFGTGPAIKKIIDANCGDESILFYHPQSFEVLRALLAVVEQLQKQELDELPQLLHSEGLCEELAQIATQALLTMGIAKAISHCRKQGKSEEQFLRQFHQWFDGFRTLKFLHRMRDAALPMQNLAGAYNLQPTLFPASMKSTSIIDTLRAAIRQQWQWSTDHELTDNP